MSSAPTLLPSLQDRVRHSDDARYHGPPRTHLRTTIRGVITHLTDGATWAGAKSWLNRADTDAPASYHYGIDRDGTIDRMLHPDVIAYHAGYSRHPRLPYGGASVNAITVGIAFACGCGSDARPSRDRLTPAQLESGLWLHATMLRDYRVPADCVLGHREVSPGRKFDPLPRILNMDAWRERLRHVRLA